MTSNMVNITVFNIDAGDSMVFQLASNSDIDILKSLIEAETGIPSNMQILSLNSTLLRQDIKTIAQAGISDNSLITVTRASRNSQNTPNTLISTRDRNTTAATTGFNHGLSGQLLGNPSQLSTLLHDPLSVEGQRFLEQRISQEQISQNLSLAHEYLPESFGIVTMLYINVEINKVPVQAFIDSGSQITVMSRKCAERCNLLRLIDGRFQGVARGVGTSKIVGKIHLADMKIGKSFYAASFTILDSEDIEMIFGLDMLRRHQCKIDLKNEMLVIGDDQVPFLPERAITAPVHREALGII